MMAYAYSDGRRKANVPAVLTNNVDQAGPPNKLICAAPKRHPVGPNGGSDRKGADPGEYF
jgi:hypothetical protein